MPTNLVSFNAKLGGFVFIKIINVGVVCFRFGNDEGKVC